MQVETEKDGKPQMASVQRTVDDWERAVSGVKYKGCKYAETGKTMGSQIGKGGSGKRISHRDREGQGMGAG